jgi:hypothetical protein
MEQLTIRQEAVRELVRNNQNSFSEALKQAITDYTFISINQAAGLLGVHPDTARGILKDHIIKISSRQHRVQMKCLEAATESLKIKNMRKRARLEATKNQGRLDI